MKRFTGLRRLADVILLALVGAIAGRAQGPTDGTTPTGMAPGSPLSAYVLSGFDDANLFNGKVNFALPLLRVQGRGEASYMMTLQFQSNWMVQLVPRPGLPPAEFAHATWWTPYLPGYGPGTLFTRTGVLRGGCPSGGSVSPGANLPRLTFISPDGTEHELRDLATEGQPVKVPNPCQAGPNFYDAGRGTVFVSRDATAMTFISDSRILDWSAPRLWSTHNVTRGF